MNYLCIIFYNVSSASGGFDSKPPAGLHPWTLLGDFRPQTINLPTPGKNPVGAHDHLIMRNVFGNVSIAISDISLKLDSLALSQKVSV